MANDGALDPGAATGPRVPELLTPLPLSPRGGRLSPARKAGVAICIAIWVICAAVVVMGTQGRPQTRAVVEGRGAAAGRIRVHLVDRTKAWDIPWRSQPQRGALVTIELTGRCRCVPHQPPESFPLSAQRTAAVVAMVLVNIALGNVGPVRRRRRMQRSAEALARGPVTAVWVCPALLGAGPDALRWFELTDASSGSRIGRLQMDLRRRRPDFSQPLDLYGSHEPGAAVALATRDGAGVVLPFTGLVTEPSPPPHPLADVVDHIAGWRTPTPGREVLVPAAAAIPPRRTLVLLPWMTLAGFTASLGPMVLSLPPWPRVLASALLALAALRLASRPFARLQRRWIVRPLARAITTVTGLAGEQASFVAEHAEVHLSTLNPRRAAPVERPCAWWVRQVALLRPTDPRRPGWVPPAS